MARGHSRTSPRETQGWTPEQAAEFAARRDFRLLQLLSKDRRAEAAARRLGLFNAPTNVSQKLPRNSSGKKATGQPARREADAARAQDEPQRSPKPPNSDSRRSARRAARHTPRHLQVSQEGKGQQQLNPDAPAFQMLKDADPDVQMASDASASPRTEQRDVLREASEALAAKQAARQPGVVQPQPQPESHVETTRRKKGKGRKRASASREGPGLEPLSESELAELRGMSMQDEEL